LVWLTSFSCYGDLNIKLFAWRGFQAIFGLEAAPVGGFGRSLL